MSPRGLPQPLHARPAKSSRLGGAVLCVATLLIVGCGGASAPQNVSGVRALYRSIGLDASSGEFTDICQSYMDQRLRAEFAPTDKNCLTTTFERWAEKVRSSDVGSKTRIVVSGREARIYREVKPETATYVAGQWQLAEVPPSILPRPTAGK